MMNLSPPLSAGRLKLAQGLAWLAPFIRWTWLLHLFGRLRKRWRWVAASPSPP